MDGPSNGIDVPRSMSEAIDRRGTAHGRDYDHRTGLGKERVSGARGKRGRNVGVGAATRLGVSQPDVSRLMKKRPAGFSTDRLLALLTALDIDVDIVLRPARTRAHSAKVSIREERL
jgi:hypothetical protein